MHHSCRYANGGESLALPTTWVPPTRRLCLLLVLAIATAHAQLVMKRQALLGLGTRTGPGKLHVMDSDRDGLGEFVYASWVEGLDARMWGIAEYRPVNSYVLVQADTGEYSPLPLIGGLTPFAVADVDQDGLLEIWGEIPFTGTATDPRWDWICAVESEDSTSYPHVLSWWCHADTLRRVGHDYWPIADLDQDSLYELVTSLRANSVAVFENTGPDQCSLVFCFYEHDGLYPV